MHVIAWMLTNGMKLFKMGIYLNVVRINELMNKGTMKNIY